MGELYNKSLIEFYQLIAKKFLNFQNENSFKVLDIGSSSYSLFEDVSDRLDVTAIDKNVDSILSAPTSKINYKIASIEQFESIEKFDLIFDSHAIHCILDLEKRKAALKNIYNLLSEDGIFSMETMIRPMNSGLDFLFNERLVMDSLEIEKELISINFKIKYFMINQNLYFQDAIDANLKCDLLRIIVQK
jgi:SAM-dependent methyltransferase